jgi:hypothetical protein
VGAAAAFVAAAVAAPRCGWPGEKRAAVAAAAAGVVTGSYSSSPHHVVAPKGGRVARFRERRRHGRGGNGAGREAADGCGVSRVHFDGRFRQVHRYAANAGHGPHRVLGPPLAAAAKHGRHVQLQGRRGAACRQGSRGRVLLEHRGVEAHAVHGRHKRGRHRGRNLGICNRAWVEGDGGAGRSQIHGHRRHARDRFQRALHRGRAVPASHALHVEAHRGLNGAHL